MTERAKMRKATNQPDQIRREIMGSLTKARYRASVGDRILGTGTLQEAQALVSQEMTQRVADDPEGMAGAAQKANRAFATREVEETCDRQGVWTLALPGGDLLRVSWGRRAA